MRNRLRNDQGITITELAVALFVSSIIATGAITWAIAVNNADVRNREALEIVDELRWAKTEIVKELRFAFAVFPPSVGDDEISMHVDVNGDSEFQPDIGELVTYRITPGGVLERSSDLSGDPVATMARSLLPAQSSITLVGTNQVVIEFVADTDASDNVSARTIKTTVNVRHQN